MKLLDALITIAKKFNEEDINWNVGASLLLYFYNIVDAPNDIDIIIHKEDQKKAFEIMNTLGEQQATAEVREYNTGIFGKFIVNSVEVDIIGEFEILIDEGDLRYLHPYDDLSVSKVIMIRNTEIPLGSLEDWYITYAAMGDPKGRLELIEEYLITHNCIKKKNFKRILENFDVQTKKYFEKYLNSAFIQ
jgi:hypothetical protein